MREAIQFNYNNIASEDMGVIAISTKNGLYEDIFTPTRKIVEQISPYTSKRYYQRMEYEPISFPLTILIEEWQDRNNLREIARWLFQDYYKPLIFETNTNRVYFAMIEGSSKLFHNGLKEGYIEVNVRCNSPYIYSHPMKFDNITNHFSFYYDGDLPVKPVITILKNVSQGDVTIENVTTNQKAILKNIGNGEEVIIDFDTEQITSSYESNGVYRYDDFNDEWLYLMPLEENIIKITGNCSVDIEYRAIYLAE